MLLNDRLSGLHYWRDWRTAGIVATLILMFAVRNKGVMFWWTLTAFVALLAMHAIFWLITQSVNRYWLKNQGLGTAGSKFFALDRANRVTSSSSDPNWKHLCDRWEYSHIVRAVLSAIALIALVVAIAI